MQKIIFETRLEKAIKDKNDHWEHDKINDNNKI
jgi:hypothetical protein